MPDRRGERTSRVDGVFRVVSVKRAWGSESCGENQTFVIEEQFAGRTSPIQKVFLQSDAKCLVSGEGFGITVIDAVNSSKHRRNRSDICKGIQTGRRSAIRLAGRCELMPIRVRTRCRFGS